MEVKKVKENILATLVYFDLFKYPLTGNEVYLFLRKKIDQADFDLALKRLVADQSVYQFGDYYALQNNHMLVVRRGDANKRAAELRVVAEEISDVLIKIPFVRAISMSGLRSKNLINPESSIDLFIITAKNRLWIARFIMLVFKKLKHLINKEDCFSLNHIIDEEQLEVKEQTIYKARDLVTLIPLQGDMVIEQFYMANNWISNFLPHQIMRISSAKPEKSSIFKLLFERLFRNALGDAIDNALMRIATGRRKKQGRPKKLNSNNDALGIDAGKHHIKPALRNFPAELISQHNSNISQLQTEPQNLLAN